MRIHRILCTTIFALAIALLLPQKALAGSQPEFNLSPEVAIKLILLDKMRSGDSKRHSQVNYKVDEDIVDKDGNTLIRKGTPAYGTVVNSRRSGMFGQRGALDISVDYTNAIDGQRVNLRSNKERRGGGSKGLVTAGAILVAWPLAFCKGSNVSIEAGKTMVAFVNDNLIINTGTMSAANDLAAQNASANSSAQKNIVLQNGEHVSGQMLSLQNGVYAIKTKQGILNIKKNEIASIETAAGPVAAAKPPVTSKASGS